MRLQVLILGFLLVYSCSPEEPATELQYMIVNLDKWEQPDSIRYKLGTLITGYYFEENHCDNSDYYSSIYVCSFPDKNNIDTLLIFELCDRFPSDTMVCSTCRDVTIYPRTQPNVKRVKVPQGFENSFYNNKRYKITYAKVKLLVD